MAGTLIENVSDTAFWIAHYRALETERADALFRDPLASVLAGDRGKEIARTMPGSFMTAWTVVIRTCIIDDYIQLAVAQGVDTVLNLGAGLDTRPYRMELPGSFLWIEADYPKMIEYKEKRLANEKPRCRLERVKLDLAKPLERREMLAAANARAKRILILTEGVVPYLSVEEAGSLADDLNGLDRASYWVVEYFAPQVIKFRKRMMQRKMQNAPFKFEPQDWFGFFGEHGWHCKEIRYMAEEAERLQRPIRLSLPVRMIFGIRRLFSSSEKRAAYKKFMGYVLLEHGNVPARQLSEAK
ncbi:MAG: SAM-dependent methyltransferase [Candidatus Acidiferrum sp.]